MPRPKKNKAKVKKKPTPNSLPPSLSRDVLDVERPEEIHPYSDALRPDGEANAADASCIENRWNGPRVLDVDVFLVSRYAAAPNVEDVDCAVFTVPEVRDMFLKVLPKENALILWYNKSRKSARICPACRRYYAVRDILLPHLLDDQTRAEYVDPRNLREKQISGLCSLMCFGIASYNWPGSIGAWGKCSSEIDATTRAILLGPGANIADDGMGTLMKLSRVENLLDILSEAYDTQRKLY